MTGAATLAAQAAIAAMVLAIAALAPPARGAVLLLPLASRPVAALAIASEANLLSTGPLRGSLVVMADRPLFTLMLRQGVLAVRATPGNCHAPSPKD